MFTLTVSNAGPSDATGVTVLDQLPSGYEYVSDNGGVSYDAVTGVWDIGTIATGGSASLEITATVLATGEYTNSAQVATSNEKDPDSTPGDDSTLDDDDDTESTTPVPVARKAIEMETRCWSTQLD